jgi:hypothetical protein
MTSDLTIRIATYSALRLRFDGNNGNAPMNLTHLYILTQLSVLGFGLASVLTAFPRSHEDLAPRAAEVRARVINAARRKTHRN